MEFLNNNIISDFFVICLKGLYTLFNDYALAIVILTILLRLCVLPLDIKQRRNQAKMSALGPELQSLQKRYANNPQQLQKKQRELYSKMNVKPMLGCLQSLIQLPIWFAFFGAMRVLASEQTVGLMLDAATHGAQSVALPDFFWVHNFWQPDSGLAPILPDAQSFLSFVQTNAVNISPQTLSLMQSNGILTFSDGIMNINADVYNTLSKGMIEANGIAYTAAGVPEFNNGWFILPAISGAALFLQQKFAPAASSAMPMPGVDPNQTAATPAQQPGGKFMLWFFPIFSIYICATSNSAFALYWIVSSLYAFTQMRIIDMIRKRKENKAVVVSG